MKPNYNNLICECDEGQITRYTNNYANNFGFIYNNVNEAFPSISFPLILKADLFASGNGTARLPFLMY